MDNQRIQILFCDNEPSRHILFRQYVTPQLQQRFRDYEIIVDHSQSLDDAYEPKYDEDLIALGAKSVWTLMDQSWSGDLVVSDINFFKEYEMGSARTGIEILQLLGDHSSRLYWCEAVLITRFYGEQDHDLYREAGAIMPNRWSYVEMAGEAEENWKRVSERVVEHLTDVLAVKQGLHKPPDLYRLRLFRSKSEGAVWLTVWDKSSEICLYKGLFEELDMDILIVLHRAQGAFLPQEVLRRRVMEEQRSREGQDVDNLKSDKLRGRIKSIRKSFKRTHNPRFDTTEIRRAGKIHETDHLEKHVCGGCVIFNQKHSGAGYAFGGQSVLVELPDEDSISIHNIMTDPIESWRQFDVARGANA